LDLNKNSELEQAWGRKDAAWLLVGVEGVHMEGLLLLHRLHGRLFHQKMNLPFKSLNLTFNA